MIDQVTSSEENFWSKVNKKGYDECWEWTAGSYGRGYGAFYVHRISIPSHRYSYSLVYGEIPSGMFICHHCDNPKCVNPKHLFMGTCQDNNDDMVRKGRARGGSHKGNTHRAKLTPDQVMEIREMLSNGIKATVVAKQYSVAKSTIGSIKTGQSWGHLGN